MKKKSGGGGLGLAKNNPFEEQWIKKTKNDLLAKKRERPNSRAFTFSGRNKVQDQRVGEKNPKLSEEDRYLARLQRERSRGTKKRKRFNIEDDVEEEEGQRKPGSKNLKVDEFPMKDPTAWKYFMLNEANDDYQEGSENGDSDVEESTDKRLSRTRVDGNARDSDSDASVEPRTHQEVMNEVMMKSKMYKEQRQQTKAADEIQREALDEALPELMDLLRKSDEQKPASVDDDDDTNASSFNYEATLQALTMDRRAQPTHRLKTKEEKEVEERERLEELERTRLARMRGTDEIDEDDDNAVESDSSEDIDDNAENMQDEDEVEVIRDGQIEIQDEVPYLFKKCPSTPAELASLLLKTTVSLRGVVIERLLKCFAVSLNSSNGPKLKRLLELFLGRIQSLSRSVKNVPLVVEEIEILTVHCYSLASKYPSVLIDWAKERLYSAYSDLQENREENLSVSWTIAHLLILRVIGQLFPGSDVRHGIMTPFFILISESISPARLKSDKDFALATFLCSIILELSSPSTRVSGQIVQFLATALASYPCSAVSANETKSTNGVDRNSGTPLLISDLVEEETTSAHFRVKLGFAIRKLALAALYRGRMCNLDLIYAPISKGDLTDGETKSALCKLIKEQGATRKPLKLYTEKSVAIPKGLNPKFTATNGVFKKNNRGRFGLSSTQQSEESAKRIRKALNKEERGYARDLRNEAALRAQQQYEQESAKRDYSNAKTKELKLFLEEQQSTWNQAAKKQKKLSGKKW